MAVVVAVDSQPLTSFAAVQGIDMGYYVRAFCRSPGVPTLRQALDSVRAKGIDLQSSDPADLDNPTWTHLALLYKKGKKPILVECNRETADNPLCRDEVKGFLDEISRLPDSAGKTRVIDHLNGTEFIIACQLPVLNMGDDQAGYLANDAFLRYFEAHCGGMIQADGEGFYAGQEMVLEME
jgi:hypothetical protein